MELNAISVISIIEQFENLAKIDILYATMIKKQLESKINYWVSPAAYPKTRLNSIKTMLPYLLDEELIEITNILLNAINYYENFMYIKN